MAKFYRVMGVLSVIGSVIGCLVVLFDNFLVALISLAVGVISAFPWFTLANLLERVEILEWGSRKQTPPTIEEKPETPASGSLKDALDW